MTATRTISHLYIFFIFIANIIEFVLSFHLIVELEHFATGIEDVHVVTAQGNKV